ncbi:GMC oxidoreductase [Halorubrum salipaludis]|nr:GMC family oxidoreductase [Halorubrum salipaludis]
MTSDFKVCIIGSGIAGSLAALKLQEREVDVTVLEAGSWEDSLIDSTFYEVYDRFPWLKNLAFKIPGFTYPWVDSERDRFTNSGEREYDINKRRHKGIGGTVGRIKPIWHGWAIRPYPEDFNKNSEFDFGADWPLSYRDLEPYYFEAEQEMAVAGRADNPYRDREEYPIQKPKFDDLEQVFSPLEDQNILNIHSIPIATDPDTNDLSLFTTNSHIQRGIDEGVDYISNAVVRRLRTGDQGDRIDSVLYTKNGETRNLCADHFVVAAGGIESARLLLLSKNTEHPTGIANSSGCVGKYFMEHPMLKVTGDLEDPRRDILSEEANGELVSHEYYKPSEENPHSIMIGFRKQSGKEVSLLGVTEMAPQENNRISLNKKVTDDYNEPVPDISLSFNDRNTAALERVEKILLELCEILNVKVKSIHGPENPIYVNHHIGTTRMGDDPDTSVVNRNLRTHDIRNLSIISSSVFPTGFGVNPTLTIAALSLRAVDHICEQLGK